MKRICASFEGGGWLWSTPLARPLYRIHQWMCPDARADAIDPQEAGDA